MRGGFGVYDFLFYGLQRLIDQRFLQLSVTMRHRWAMWCGPRILARAPHQQVDESSGNFHSHSHRLPRPSTSPQNHHNFYSIFQNTSQVSHLLLAQPFLIRINSKSNTAMHVAWICSVPSDTNYPGQAKAIEELAISVAVKYGYDQVTIR
jgi:hypothetical protein